jgi:hypothetical protein
VTEPVRPEPDVKDWTWTLRKRCPDCGFAAGDTRAADVPPIVEDVFARFSDRLDADDARLRPNPTTWSPTEYACHIRDVCMVFELGDRLKTPAGRATRGETEPGRRA